MLDWFKKYFLIYFYSFISWLIIILFPLISVLFVTLMERKMLSYIGFRKGPKKVGFLGYTQPVGDAMKLFGKEMGHPWVSKKIIFWLSPMIVVLMFLFCWTVVNFENSFIFFTISALGFLCMSSLGVYVLLSGGWSSKNKYTIMGSLRGACQSISYEVSLIFYMLMPLIFFGSLSFCKIWQSNISFLFFGLISMVFVWLFICVCETNRAPFDFTEGESELVSGFNVEYGALQFAFLYLGEYGMMIFLSYLSSFLFFINFCPLLSFFSLLVIYFYMWIRGTLPRFRYDLLMEVSWLVMLPLSMFWIIFFLLR